MSILLNLGRAKQRAVFLHAKLHGYYAVSTVSVLLVWPRAYYKGICRNYVLLVFLEIFTIVPTSNFVLAKMPVI